jgi:hypothetical protein
VLRRAAQPTPQDHTEESADDICTGKDSNHETRAIGETVIILTSTSKQFPVGQYRGVRSLQRTVRTMPLKRFHEPDHAEVVERALFATRNSLKSHEEENLFSPIRKTHAITQKLWTHSSPAAVEKHPASKSKLGAALNSR